MIALVHLSDLHITSERDPLISKDKALAHSLRSIPSGVTDCILALTGDIAFSGLSEQYNIAKRIIKSCVDELQAVGITPHVVTVPGNHDCAFPKEDTVRMALLNAVRGDTTIFTPSFAALCCAPQTAYMEFASAYHSPGKDVAHPLKEMYNRITLPFGQFAVTFHLFNTSWCSQEKEKPATLFIPEIVITEAQQPSSATLNIALLHHSLNWLIPENARSVRTLLDQAADIVLTGHEHVSTLRLQKELTSSLETLMCEGDVLGEDENKDKSAYSVMLIDLEKQKYIWDKYEWTGELYRSNNFSTDWSSLTSRVRRSAFHLNISPYFQQKIDDAGAAFKHPRVTRLSLEEIYVPPELREVEDVSYSKGKLSYNKIGFYDLTFENDKINHYLITGASVSGKTALCYQVFKAAYKNNMLPIYIDASGTNPANQNDIERLMEASFKKEYTSSHIDAFHQMERSKKLLIIDNFHATRLNAVARTRLLHQLSKKYNHILITADILFTLEELTKQAIVERESDGRFKLLQILPFGHVSMSILITKWIEIGQVDNISQQDLTREHDDMKHTLDSVLGQNLVPAHPLFLLIILQQCEGDIPHDIQSSAYGYYYEYLIIQALRGISKKNEDIDAYYNYITELANHLYEKHYRQISDQDLREFHVSHCQIYRITSSDFTQTVGNLIRAQILFDEEGAYRFRYPYVYYFFLARYLAHNMTNQEIRDRVKKMCDRIYQKEFSNVIMFLTHLSKDPFILEQILAMARNVFSEDVPYQFERPIETITQLLVDVPRLVLEDRDVTVERQKTLEVRDRNEPRKADDGNKLLEQDYDIDEEIKVPAITEHIAMSIKTIEILGQILRNYYGSLKADVKLELAEETYMIALRAIRNSYTSLMNNLDGLVKHISNILQDLGITKEKERENIANRLCFLWFVLIPDVYIQQVTKAVANKNLSGTFSDVLERHQTPGVRMIDLAIKMASNRSFPIDDAHGLAKDIRGDALASHILKCLVLEHLYFFPRPFNERQSICKRLDIPMEDQKKLMIHDHQSLVKPHNKS